MKNIISKYINVAKPRRMLDESDEMNISSKEFYGHTVQDDYNEYGGPVGLDRFYQRALDFGVDNEAFEMYGSRSESSIMKVVRQAYKEYKKCFKLNESDSFDDDIKIYMNTWKNYNVYGADLEMYGIKDGWMSVDDALDFCKKYAEDEPFINDVDNCPIEISEYDNAVSKLQELKKIEELPSDEQEMVGYFLEHGSYKDLDEIVKKVQDGDYTFFPGVDNSNDLGKAYFDMVGIEGISNPFQYVDRNQIMRSFRDNDSEEDLSDDDYYAMADEEIENAEADGNLQYAEDNFDYEALGRDLEIDGYTYVSGGALMVF